MNLFHLNRFRGLIQEANMNDQRREEEYARRFTDEGNRFYLVGEYADGSQEDVSVNGSFNVIQDYLDENRDDLFNHFVAIHIKREEME